MFLTNTIVPGNQGPDSRIRDRVTELRLAGHMDGDTLEGKAEEWREASPRARDPAHHFVVDVFEDSDLGKTYPPVVWEVYGSSEGRYIEACRKDLSKERVITAYLSTD